MSEMVDAVASALWEDACPGMEWGDADRTMYTRWAGVAVRAMREPTDTMMTAGTAFVYEGWASKEAGQKAIAKESWQAMIDEALK